MFDKILIANRGEIALRVIRACREMGIQSVAVHSTADADAMHVRMADESICIGPPSGAQSYLSIPAIISACEISGAQAIHPGYGFLSENANFVQIVEDHGITFIGPSAEHIRQMGDKITAKDTAKALGIPCVPGSDGGVPDVETAKKVAADMGYPVIIKATAGGGGRGMKVAETAADLVQAFQTARSRIQGRVWQRRSLHGEVSPEAAPHRDPSLWRRSGRRRASGRARLLLAAASPEGVRGSPRPLHHRRGTCPHRRNLRQCHRQDGLFRQPSTVEFLYEDGEFYFIEMNTRLQVEHPVTEAIFGQDLVREQILVASGQKLSFSQDDLQINGHAIEVRINAEKLPNFSPCPGKITAFHAPGGLGVRMDSALYDGYSIPPYYDSLIGKLIVHGRDRDEALARLSRSLGELIVDGVDTTVPLFHALLQEKDVQTGDYNIHWLEKWLDANL